MAMDVYMKIIKRMLIIIEVYVDEIIFESDDDRLSQQFAKDKHETNTIRKK